METFFDYIPNEIISACLIYLNIEFIKKLIIIDPPILSIHNIINSKRFWVDKLAICDRMLGSSQLIHSRMDLFVPFFRRT